MLVEKTQTKSTTYKIGKTAPQLIIPGLMGEYSESFSVSEDKGQREFLGNDSDSDGLLCRPMITRKRMRMKWQWRLWQVNRAKIVLQSLLETDHLRKN